MHPHPALTPEPYCLQVLHVWRGFYSTYQLPAAITIQAYCRYGGGGATRTSSLQPSPSRHTAGRGGGHVHARTHIRRQAGRQGQAVCLAGWQARTHAHAGRQAGRHVVLGLAGMLYLDCGLVIEHRAVPRGFMSTHLTPPGPGRPDMQVDMCPPSASNPRPPRPPRNYLTPQTLAPLAPPGATLPPKPSPPSPPLELPYTPNPRPPQPPRGYLTPQTLAPRTPPGATLHPKPSPPSTPQGLPYTQVAVCTAERPSIQVGLYRGGHTGGGRPPIQVGLYKGG